MQLHFWQKTRRNGGFANIFASGLRREHVHERGGATIGKIRCAAAVKCLIGSGCKTQAHLTNRRFFTQPIQHQAVITYNIFYIIGIFQSAFNLEGSDTRLQHIAQDSTSIQIIKR